MSTGTLPPGWDVIPSHLYPWRREKGSLRVPANYMYVSQKQHNDPGQGLSQDYCTIQTPTYCPCNKLPHHPHVRTEHDGDIIIILNNNID